MKILSRLVTALLFCLVVISFASVPAQAQAPQILISPTSGPPGQQAYIYGTGLSGYTGSSIYIRFYTTSTDYTSVATLMVPSDGNFTAAYFTIPECAKGDHLVYAYNVNGNIASTIFTVTPRLEIGPSEGLVDTTVMVKGRGFGQSETGIQLSYYLDGGYRMVANGIAANSYGSWDVTFRIPASSRGSHRIDAAGDISSLDQVQDATFTVKPGISLSKSSGSVGDSITVSGSGFSSNEAEIKVSYDGAQAGSSTTANNDGSWTIPFSVPPSAKGVHRIDASGLSTPATDIADKEFTVSPVMTLVPNSGHVGSNLTVSGNGFAGSKMVSVAYDGAEKGSGTTDGTGRFSEISFSVPKSIHGKHTVAVTDADGNKASADFTMESQPPPTPVLLSRPQGSRVGFLGNVTTTFEWSPVTDESGVVYTFQIATSQNFTAPLLSLTDLSAANYTLTQQQALPHGTYYWRVKAIDGAQNEGNWTSPYSLKAGLLSLWQLIVIIVLAIVLISVLVCFSVEDGG